MSIRDRLKQSTRNMHICRQQCITARVIIRDRLNTAAADEGRNNGLRGHGCSAYVDCLAMKILVTDRISPAGVDLFRQQTDFEVVEAYGATPEELLSLIAEADALAVRSETRVTSDVITAAKRLKVVGRAGVGVDNIDIDAATERGIIVMNTPDGNTIATAELTFTHILCGTRPVAQASRAMRGGRWDRKLFTGSELNGKVLGICGLGRIGAEVARRAQAFGMQILAYDPFLTDSRAKQLGVQAADFDTVVSNADYITVHMPLNEQTKHMINSEVIARMKDGVRLFNCARGGIIEENALINGIKSGKVAAAGLDVFENEPLSEQSELRQLDNVVLTPHLGASTVEAQESVGVEVARQMIEVLTGGMVRNAINMPSVDPKVLEELRPYLELGEKLGTFIQQLTNDQVNQLVITYYGRVTGLDSMPVSRAVQRGYLKHICAEPVNDVNAPKKMQQLGVRVDIIKSGENAEFVELIEIKAVEATGKVRSVAGTLFGRTQIPRIVSIDGHGLELNTRGILLVIKNSDVPGIVGFVGSTLGEDKVNIGNLSLSREPGRDFAISVFELDTPPSAKAQKALQEHPGIEKYKIIRL